MEKVYNIGVINKHKIMNNVKTLQVTLAIVVVASAIFGGVSSYRYSALNAEVKNFSQNVQRAQSDDDLRAAARHLLINTNQDPLAMSASADYDVSLYMNNPTFSPYWCFFWGMCEGFTNTEEPVILDVQQ
jgi:hypothetical protein